jgi:outer membrane protein OmpA-like peptidoglycan-associated protein
MIKYLAPMGLVALAACSDPGNPGTRAFDSPAGAITDSQGLFGAATMNNKLVMTGQQSAVMNLAKRFAEAVPNTVNFAFDSAVLDAEARQILRAQADFIRQFPELRFRVYGHTDLVGSAGYNKQLGLRRANAVVNYFASLGISRDRLEAKVSFGETQPLIPTPNRERLNRRTVTEVSGFYERHPTVLDGNYAQVIYREYVASAVPATELEGITGSDLTTEQ